LGFLLSDDPSIDHRPSAIGHRWLVTVPTFRVDVQREVDLIEEIARHDGYQGLPATFPKLDVPQAPPDPRALRDRRLRHVLTACGFSEAQTFSFIEVESAEPFAAAAADGADRDENAAADLADSADSHKSAADLAEDALIRVANPLSEKFAVLRPSLLAGLVDAAAHNRRRQHADVRLFETGTRFTARGEVRSVAGVWTGAALPAHWSGGARQADFYDMKGVVDAIGSAFAGGRAVPGRRQVRVGDRRCAGPDPPRDCRGARVSGARAALGVRARRRRAWIGRGGRGNPRDVVAAVPVDRTRPLDPRG
jgi:phenylalanyl-tRNA synthetase beta subunit